MKLKGIERALEYGRLKQGVGHPKIDFLAGYNKAVEDTKASEILEMLQKILEINKHHNFNGHLINEQIEQLIKQATEI